MAIVRNIVKLRNLKICMESVGMRYIGKLDITETDPIKVFRSKKRRSCDSF